MNNIDLRRVEYRIPNDGIMVLRVGQEMSFKSIDFIISHIRRGLVGQAIVVQVFIRKKGEKVSGLWKEIVNGSTVLEYNVDFLCL